MNKLILKIRQRETPFFKLLYNIAHQLQRINVPEFLIPCYRILFVTREIIVGFYKRVITLIYLEPMFRSRCKKVGKGLNYVKLQQSFPYISGNIQIYIEDNVTVHSRSSFSATKIFDEPILRIGEQTYLGPGLSIGTAKEIFIGSYCHIASNVTISDNDGHPIDPIERAKHKPVDKNEVKPVHIGDYVWVGEGACILKGVSIGRCSIVAAKSVVTKNIEPYSIVAGNPAVVVKKM